MRRRTTSSAAARPEGRRRRRLVAAEFREAIRLRPDYAEAHNNLGLVLIQAATIRPASPRSARPCAIAPDYADAHTNLGAALTPTDAAEAIRELEKAVALAPASVKAQFNLAMAYGAEPDAGSGEGDRAAPEGHRARRRRSRGRTSRSARRCCRTARLPEPSRRCRKRRGSSRQAARRTISSVSRSRARAGRRTPRRRCRRAASSSPPTIAISRPHSTCAEGRAALEKGELDAGRGEVPARGPAPSGLGRCAARPRGALREAAQARRGRGAEAARANRHRRRRQQRPPRCDGCSARRSARSAELEGYIRDGRYRRGRAAARRVREGAPVVLLGLVRARLQPVRAAEDRRVDPGAGEVAAARRHATPRRTRFSAAT